MKKFVLVVFAILMVLAIPMSAQNQNDGDTVVSVPKKYVSAEGLNHQQQQVIPEKLSEWAGIGKEIGVATKEGLNAVVDAAEKFGTTRVGTFVMVMIAWKLMSHQILGIFLGIPILIGGVIVWWQTMKRLFFGYQVLDKKEGKVKTYKRQAPYDFDSSDARAGAGIACWVTLVVFLAVMGLIIFG